MLHCMVPAREEEGGRGCAPFPRSLFYLSHGPFAVCMYSMYVCMYVCILFRLSSSPGISVLCCKEGREGGIGV